MEDGFEQSNFKVSYVIRLKRHINNGKIELIKLYNIKLNADTYNLSQ